MNQCDGCLAGKPLVDGKFHVMGNGSYRDLMVCERDKYGNGIYT